MATKPKKPNIQIDDVEREMTDEEYEIYLLIIAAEPTRPVLPTAE